MLTIIIKVDLECSRCHTKMEKVLDRIREKGEFVIDDIEYKEKNNRVIVSGPFDADKLCCKAGSIIQVIEIVEPKPSPKKEEPKPPPPEKKTEPPAPPPKKPVVEKPTLPPTPAPPKVVEVPYLWPYPYPWPSGGCCCHHRHGGCHCSSCGRQEPPPPAPQP